MPFQLMRHARLGLLRRSGVIPPLLSSNLVVGGVCRRRSYPFHNGFQRRAAAILPALHTCSRLCSSWAAHDSAPSSSSLKPEMISLDCIEVIGTSVETSTCTFGTATTTSTTTAEERVSSFTGCETPNSTAMPEVHTPSSSTRTTAATELYCDVHKVDPFARGRISNFIRRMGRNEGEIFHVREVPRTNGGGGDATAAHMLLPPLYIATCRVPLPQPHGSHIAEGLAEDRKEAELLAAMHAERVCDALGVPLFRLKTAQQKHVETVRREEGRYAPLPGDPLKPPGTPIPPPLRLLRSHLSLPPIPPHSFSSSLASKTDVTPPQTVSASVKTTEIMGVVAGARAAAVHPSQNTEGNSRDTSNSLAGDVRCSNTVKINNVIPCDDTSRVEKHKAVPSLALDANNTPAGDASFTWPTSPTTTAFLSRHPHLNESRRHDPYRLYAAYGPTFTDAEHAERVRSYASTVVYPWQNGWEGATGAQETTVAASLPRLRGNNMVAGDVSSSSAAEAAAAAAAAAVASINFDPTENGLWQMVNSRNVRCSPTPNDALVLPYVFDGPHALTRIKEYYKQHGTTLEAHMKVHSVSTPGYTTRMTEAELRLVGVSVTARGKSQTEEMAVRLAAMHAELLLDALGLPLFPRDAERQARHAEVVSGYGRWALNPLARSAAAPNPHDALPRPLKSQVGTDDIWLSPDASPQMRSRRTESEHIIAAHNCIIAQSEDMVELNPPQELLEEAYAMLQAWQKHIARSRYTNLYVLFDMDNDIFRATTITPVPAHFGVRGGNATAVTHTKAMQLCALHAMDTLCALGVPLCVDAEQERRYLQRRAALGQVMPNMLHGLKEWKARPLPNTSLTNGRKMMLDALKAQGSVTASPAPTIPYLPSYALEGQQTRLPPMLCDTVHAIRLRLPQDFCLYSGADNELAEIGNEAKICVSNYIEQCTNARMREIRAAMTSMGIAKAKYASPFLVAGAAVDEDRRPEDHILRTEMWAANYLKNAPPTVYITGYSSQTSIHCIAYLQLPLPAPPISATITTVAAEKDGHPQRSGVAVTVCSAIGGSTTSVDRQLRRPAYVIATGISLKRKDAVRACYVHAASLLHALGVDVLSTYTQSTPRVRRVPNYAALEKYLGKEAVVIVPPFTPDGQPNTQPLGTIDSAGACVDVCGIAKRDGVEGGAARGPPRAVVHNILKTFLEDSRHVTLPKRRYAARPNSPFTPGSRRRM